MQHDPAVIPTYETPSPRQGVDGRDRDAARLADPRRSTVGQALRDASDQLGAISDAPRVEAEMLLMHVIDASRSALLTHPEQRLTSVQLATYRTLVDDRVLGQPIAYLTGKIEFYGLEIDVTPEVLIPRPETEMLVELALARRPGTVVDVGTGSGCIAVALAVQLPDARICAIDISPSALAVARRNAEKHRVDSQIQFIVGDLLDRRPGPVDVIVSNPPYVSAGDWASLPPAIRHHEPRLALDGGPDGLDVIRRLLSEAQGLVKHQGSLLIEIGADQGDEVLEIAQTFFPADHTTIDVHPDLAGRDRVLEVRV